MKQENLVTERIVEKRKVNSQWLRGTLIGDYDDLILNALYIEKQFSLLQQLKDGTPTKTQVENEISQCSKTRLSIQQFQQNKFILSNPSPLLFKVDPTNLFDMEKIGKKGGSIVKRQVSIQPGGQIYQVKNANSKNSVMRPLEFLEKFTLQKSEEYQQMAIQLKAKEILWTKGESQRAARIILYQAGRQKGIVVYFDTLEQAVNIRDSLICGLLLKKFQQVKFLMKNLSKIFKSKVASKMRNTMFQYNANQRANLIKVIEGNQILKQLDACVLKCFLNLGSISAQFSKAQFLHQQEQEILKMQQLKEQEQFFQKVEDKEIFQTQQRYQLKEQSKQNDNFIGFNDEQDSRQHFTSVYSQSEKGSKNSELMVQQEKRKQLWKISQSEFLQNFDREIMRVFANSWKQSAFMKKNEIQSSKKELILIFYDIEMELKMDLIKPILSIQLQKQSEVAQDLRIVNSQSVAANSEGTYYSTDLECQVKNRISPTVISWNIIPEDSRNKSNRTNEYGMNICQIRIKNYENTDSITIKLKDAGSSQGQQKAKSTFYFYELLNKSSTSQRNYLSLDLRNYSTSHQSFQPLLKLDSLISQNNNADYSISLPITSFDDYLQDCVGKNKLIIDPIYGEKVIFPTINKKQMKILSKTLEKKGIITNELKFMKLDTIQNNAIPFLQVVKKNAILKFLKQICIDNAHIKKNFDLLVRLQETLLRVRDQSAPSNQLPPLNHQPDSEERDDLGTITLSKLLSERKTWKQKCPEACTLLKDLCLEGIPNYLRDPVWKSLLRNGELRSISERSWSQFHSIRNYYSHNQMTMKGGDEEVHLSLYEHLLRESMETYVVLQQQISDDISTYLARVGERSDNNLSQLQLENILNAFVFWSVIIGSDLNSQNFSYICYSPELIEITDKIALLHLSQTVLIADQDTLQKDEEEVFWILASIVYFVLKGYYRFNPNLPHEGMRGSLKSKDYMPSMYPPLQTNKLAGIKAEILLFKILLKENIPDLAAKLNEIGLPTEHYFCNHLLTMFSSLFNSDTVFRIWDILFYESSLEQEGHKNIIMLSVLITLLQLSKEDILKCKRAADVDIVLKIYGGFVVSSGEFIKLVIENKKKFVDKLAFYLNILLNLEDELKLHYNFQFQTNLKINYYVNGKNEFDKCDAVQTGEVARIIDKLKEKDNRNKYSINKEAGDIDDSLEIPDQFDDENEREMYQLIDNKFLNHQNKSSSDAPNNFQGIKSAISQTPNIFNSNLDNVARSSNQMSVAFNQQPLQSNLNSDLFNQEEYYNHQLSYQSQLNIFKRPQLKRILLYLHKLKLFWAENTEIVMEVAYDQQVNPDIKVIVDTCIFINHYENYVYSEGENLISIKLYEDPKTLSTPELQGEKRLIKEATINICNYSADSLVKTTVLLKDKNELLHNYTTSEIEISILLLSERGIYQPIVSFQQLRMQATTQLSSYPTKLLNYLFKIDDKTKTTDYSSLRNSFKSMISKAPSLQAASNFSLDPSQKMQFRLNSEATFETVRMFLKVALNDGNVSGLSNVNFLKSVFDHLVVNNPNKTFYFSDFMMAVILFSQSTFSQKMNLCFDLLQIFDSSFECEELISLNQMLEFAKVMYDSFMIYIPDNQIYDLVEYIVQGSVNSIVKAELTVRDNSSIVFDVTKEIINIQHTNNLQAKVQFLHQINIFMYLSKCKDIFMGSSDNLSILKNVLDEKIKSQFEGLNNSQFILSIKYRIAGLLTKFSCLIDKDWKITKRIILDKRTDLPYHKPHSQINTLIKEDIFIYLIQRGEGVEEILHNNENLISLTGHEIKINKLTFVKVMGELPLLRYLVNFQNNITHTLNTSSTLNHDQFTLPSRRTLINQLQATFSVTINNQVCMTITASDDRQKRFQASSQHPNKDSHLQNPSQIHNPNSLIQAQLSMQQRNASLLIELKGKKQNMNYQNNSSINRSSISPSLSAEILNKKLSFSFFSPLSEVLLNIQNLLLQETLNQLDIGQTTLLALDLDKTYLEVFVQNTPIKDLSSKSVFDLSLLFSNQNLNFKLIYTYNKPEKRRENYQPDTKIYSMDEHYNQLAKFWYCEFLNDWMPCTIESKKTSTKREGISYFIVRFKHDPKFLFFKKPIEVLMVTQIDLNELQESVTEPFIEQGFN